jgi:hypothetical protein
MGLVLITMGAVRLVSLGLKTYIFKQADVFPVSPPYLKPASLPAGDATQATSSEPTKEELAAYERQQRTANRQREAAEAIAMIIVGAPLYFYHWRVIERDKEIEYSG